MLDEQSRNHLCKIAEAKRLNPAALMAVCEVESGGRTLATVNKRQEPLIRFEGHYFYRLLGAAKRNLAVVEGLADRRAGRVENPRTQVGRWKLLGRASAIDREAALQSVSWGMGQVMGVHWRWLEYASVDAMVSAARLGVEGQAELMLRFIEKSGLASAMEMQDWRAFARGYNGPEYAKNDYDRKLSKAYETYAVVLGLKPAKTRPGRNSPLVLKYGDRGDLVRELQLKLQKCGVAIAADGDFGPVTKRAVEGFQRLKGLSVDGLAGPETFIVLERIVG